MQKNKIMKKSKKYWINILFAVICSALIVFCAVILVLSLLNVIVIRDVIIKFIFGFLGFMLPIEKNAIERLKDSAPWETYLSFLKRKGYVKKNDRIRISYGAFVVFEVDGEYLLIKNAHGLDLYQIPAMTYSISEEEYLYLVSNFNLINDDYIKRDYKDYRFLVLESELKRFYKHFCQQYNPYEIDYSYLVNMVIEQCPIDKDVFKSCTTKFKNRYIKQIQYSRFTNKYEMNLEDIVIFIPNEEQLKELKKLKNLNLQQFKFATLEEIKSNGVNTSKGIYKADIATNAYDCFDDNIKY